MTSPLNEPPFDTFVKVMQVIDPNDPVFDLTLAEVDLKVNAPKNENLYQCQT